MEKPGAFTLRDLLLQLGGGGTYERLMAAALYDPERGYYSRNIRDIGRRGDFSTTSTLHPILGQALAAWIRASVREAGLRPPWHVIEIGGGNGTLAGQILKALPFFSRLLVRYHLVEKSPVLERLQKRRLRFRSVQWHRGMREALEAAQGRALLISNELVDAFPAVVLKKQGGRWREGSLVLEGSRIEPRWAEPDAARLPVSSFSVLGWAEAGEGQCCEAHAAYREWLHSWAPHWKKGRMLTIDYGDLFPDLYDRRPGGTLRAYFAHQTLEGLEVFARPGLQDITADVNFSDLAVWGGQFGWRNEGLQTQGDFLRAWAPSACVPDAHHPEIDFLLSPEGAGGAFKVLEQRRENGP